MQRTINVFGWGALTIGWALIVAIVVLVVVDTRASAAGMMGVGTMMGEQKPAAPAPPPEGAGYDPAAFSETAFSPDAFQFAEP